MLKKLFQILKIHGGKRETSRCLKRFLRTVVSWRSRGSSIVSLDVVVVIVKCRRKVYKLFRTGETEEGTRV
jgi:hypothetical protein